MATDQEEEDSSSEREKRGGILQEGGGSQSLGCGVLLGGRWEQNCLHKDSPGWGGPETKSGPSWLHPQSSSPSPSYREVTVAYRALNGDETL